MARRRQSRELPPPLPPERRTVGQLVGETIRCYERNFFRGIAVGLPIAVVNAFAWSASGGVRYLVVPTAALLVTLAYVAACAVVLDAPLRSRSALTAFAIGVLVFLPFPFLVAIYVLPGLAYLALVGLSVPAALVERLGVRAALRRGISLARVDYVHVLGGLATLALIVFLTQFGLFFLLREYAENTHRVAATLASLVVSPLVLFGSAILYVDQMARLRSRGPAESA
ncbi:MAG: hypothetical protein KatS3mg012_0746 [Gaiellaceae bacterium]|jgi:hypothetical protein|nr:MAG: hypothetical protein KatS3mg012_0746 [Gaiellaceae bacterium]